MSSAYSRDCLFDRAVLFFSTHKSSNDQIQINDKSCDVTDVSVYTTAHGEPCAVVKFLIYPTKPDKTFKLSFTPKCIRVHMSGPITPYTVGVDVYDKPEGDVVASVCVKG